MTGRDARPLTLDEAANQLGVHYMTVYRYVRLGQLTARRENGRWWTDQRAIDALAGRSLRKAAGERAVRWQELRRRLLSRLDAGDVRGAWSVLEAAMRAGGPPLELYVELLGPVLQQVGEEWACGTRSIEGEHRATSTALRLVGRVGARGQHAGRPRRATVVLGGTPGDPHQLPVLMVADALRWEGFVVVDLGADVPVASFVDAAATARDLVAVGVSVSVRQHRRAAAGVLRALRQAVPQTLLLAGGPAVGDRANALSLGANEWALNARDVVSVIAGRP